MVMKAPPSVSLFSAGFLFFFALVRFLLPLRPTEDRRQTQALRVMYAHACSR